MVNNKEGDQLIAFFVYNVSYLFTLFKYRSEFGFVVFKLGHIFIIQRGLVISPGSISHTVN
jgi:hypothetical protein